ncbi:MAG: hypothetical protein ACW98F_18795 [Candidatus Hodarchaeales archaeon]|jgi:hypothetical protein
MKEEKMEPLRPSILLLIIMGIIFAVRGITIFPRHGVHPLLTVLDICGLIFTGIFLAMLRIRNYSKKIVVLLGLTWFLPLLYPWVWYFIVFPSIFFVIGDYGGELIFPLIIYASLVVSLKIWKQFETSITTSNYAVYLKKVKVQPETFIALIIVVLLIFAIPLPRLFHNTINYDYTGDQEAINEYLQLEINRYFPELDAFRCESCSGWDAFIPNYIGSTERQMYITAVLDTILRAKYWMRITATTMNSVLGQEIAQEAVGNEYHLGYWNNSVHNLDSEDMTFFTNKSWEGELIYLIKEYIRWETTFFGNVMRFHQYVVFFAGNNSIITIFAGSSIAVP